MRRSRTSRPERQQGGAVTTGRVGRHDGRRWRLIGLGRAPQPTVPHGAGELDAREPGEVDQHTGSLAH